MASSIISFTQKGKTTRQNAKQALTGAFTDFHIRSLVAPRSTRPWTQDSIEMAFHLSHVKLPSYYTYCLFLSTRRLRIYQARFWKYPHPLAGCCQLSHALGGTWNEKRWWLKLLDSVFFFFLYFHFVLCILRLAANPAKHLLFLERCTYHFFFFFLLLSVLPLHIACALCFTHRT